MSLISLPHHRDSAQVGLAAEAQMIVSGDNRIRNLKTYQSIPIVGAAEALKRLPQAM
jgi:hypothetical protein